MSDLNFRIIVVPKEPINLREKEKLLSQIKSTVVICGLEVVTINYSQVRKSEDEDYLELEELCLQIQAKPGLSYPRQKIQQYKVFCRRWRQQYFSLPCSYIAIYENDYFISSRKTHHREAYEKLSFGVLPHNGLFYEYASIRSFSNNIEFYHDTRNIVIHYGEYEMTFTYDNIRNVFIDIQEEPCEIFFDLFNPPMIFRIETVYLRNGSSYNLRHRKLNLQGIDTDALGRSNVLSITLNSHENTEQIISRIHYRCSEKSINYSCIASFPKVKPPDPQIAHMHFGCTYLITAILKRNFVTVAQAQDIYQNLSNLISLSKKNPDCLEKALTAVLAALDAGKLINFWHAIGDQYYYYSNNRDEINFKDYIVPSKCSMIRRVMLTPTRQLLWPAEIMFGNRVLRNFDSEYSVRVSFRDDNMSRMSFCALHADESVFDSCIKNPMTSGIDIGYRHYDFLGWSNSQIRDHGVWMYARDSEGRSVEDIRKWMGDFSHIHNVPKYMARMGQCFSQTEDALSVPLDPQHVRTENDIEGGYDPVNYKPYCFTDGVGKISSELASKVHDALGHDKLCSAFQIRYGGCKGMLVTDPTLKDAQIVFRKSMKKFDSPQNTRLEIARTSAPVPLQLNRQFITLLNDLGVRHRTFLRLQEEMLKKLTDMLINETDATEFLKSKIPFNLFNFEELSRSGIYLTKEPLFKSFLLALHRHHIENIKSRANIAIDPTKGRNMLGVVDETGKLQYGQVFVQYTSDISFGETTKDTTILRGEILVTKNPCLYPGDVRKFQAVDIPELHHIVDCIVFPQKGPRPHPNEIAGSDLDGDEYSVLWLKDLIFHCPNENPAHFPEAHSSDVPHITVSHMIEFLQEYIKNDQVGIIANAHLVHADRLGIHSLLCISIAKKFSIAVDFAKNGSSQHLDRSERSKEYPDFMENSNKEAYKSNKALGKMYRICKDFESENQETSITYQDIKVDPDLIFDGWEKYKDNAIRSRNKYNGLLRSVLRNYGVQHETEALSGAFTKLHCRFQERKDRDEIEKVIIGCIKKLNKSMHEEFHQEFFESGNVVSEEHELFQKIGSVEPKILQKASAWYIVTYSDPDAKFLSFPWTVSKYLTYIKVQKTLANPSPFSPAIMCLDKKISECESKKLLPYYEESEIWNNYRIICDSLIIKHSLQTLILWAQDAEIVETPGRSQGLLYLDSFIKLFLHVAELQGYVSKTAKSVFEYRKAYSPGHLCLEFIKYCSSFRFYNKYEIAEILPFTLYKYSRLAKQAVVSYHRFALSGKLQNLYFDEKLHKELIQMKPVYIENKIFLRSPVDQVSLKAAEDALIKYSKVEELSMRELLQTKKICVSALGSEEALKILKSILRKKHVVLRHLFSTGVMPETPK